MYTYEEYLMNKRGYQEKGHLLLLERKHACLFYKPGKGKTYPCVDAIRDVDAMKNGDAKVLILSTADSIKNMWIPEIESQGILPKNTTLMTFNSAIVEKTKTKLVATKWDVIVVDECHKVKSHNSKTSKLVYLLSKKCEYVWGLTGTPVGNGEIDVYCQFHNMCISDWGKITYTQFVNQCCEIERKFFGGNMINTPVGILPKYKAGWEKNKAMFTQRIEYSEEDNMPDLTINTVELDYEPTKEYLQAEQGIIQVGDYENTVTKLAAILKAHQAANGYLYIPNDEGLNDTYTINRNVKLDWLLNNLTNEPTTIVYRFEADYNQIVNEIEGLYTYTESVSDFKEGKANILLLQCARCESFNLQMCKKMIFFTLDYSYIKYNQMLHRVWRMGQTQSVDIKVLILKNTVEEKIWRTVQNKEKLADLFMSIKG